MGESVRPAVAEDADALGALHVRVWQVAYRGMKPDEYLEHLSVPRMQGWWAQQLAALPEHQSIRLVAEDDGGAVVGFVIAGPSRRSGLAEPAGEVYMLNVGPDAWGKGLGQRLLRAATATLRAMGFTQAVLWVRPENSRARRFYEAAGWWPDGTEFDGVIWDVAVHDVGYRTTLGDHPVLPVASGTASADTT
jgi:ribosomal protein S18 acetylase RimI-like enzyme